MTDFSACRILPFKHQEVGTEALIRWPAFALFDEMGAGKTKQVIDAAHFLFLAGIIKQVIVIAPASVRSVWFHKELGELAKHLWDTVPSEVYELHARMRGWKWGTPPNGKTPLRWFITNYEFIGRSKTRLKEVSAFTGDRTLLVLDESSAVKNYRAKQTRACLELRNRCARVVLLNGTPIANTPMDMYSQGQILSKHVLNCKTWTEYRARYADYTTKHGFPQILGYRNLDDLARRFAPYVLRRLKVDCLDLPPKMPAVNVVARLAPETWDYYKAMREELCVWLENDVSAAAFAITKVLRLAQIASGFLGGFETLEGERSEPEREIGREKLDVFMERFDSMLEMDPNLKLLVWARFRPEAFRLYGEIRGRIKEVGMIIGSQNRDERDYALRLLDPRTAPPGPAVVVGTPQTGRTGLNLTAAHHVVYVSSDFSLFTRLQSEDRVHRPGQTEPVNYYNIIAEGPNGQKTIDHLILSALQKKEDLAALTAASWIQKLKEE